LLTEATLPNAPGASIELTGFSADSGVCRYEPRSHNVGVSLGLTDHDIENNDFAVKRLIAAPRPTSFT
jgi:hypothetical protein